MTATHRRPTLNDLLRAHVHVAERVDRDARDEADDAAAWLIVGQDVSGWWVMEHRWYRSDWTVFEIPGPRDVVISGVTREQALRCAENLAAHIRAVWADAEDEREGGTSAVTRRAS